MRDSPPTQDSTRLAGVIFDMDGVLCDSEPFIAEAAQRMFQETYGLSVTRGDFAPFVGAGEDRFIGGVAEKYGVALSMPRDKERTYAIYLDIIKGRLRPLPGAVDFIHLCRARGLKLALATSADRIKMEGNLREIGIPQSTFDAIVAGEDVVKKKPDPHIFLLAAQRTPVGRVRRLPRSPQPPNLTPRRRAHKPGGGKPQQRRTIVM